MNHEQGQFSGERYEINNLLSNPKPDSIVWRSNLIIKLSNIAELLGLKLKETKDETPEG